jgi:hypothetical protein
VVGAECVRCGRRDGERGAEILLQIQPEDRCLSPVALCLSCVTAHELEAIERLEEMTDDEKVATFELLQLKLLAERDASPTPALGRV